jgi:hypothetical protein
VLPESQGALLPFSDWFRDDSPVALGKVKFADVLGLSERVQVVAVDHRIDTASFGSVGGGDTGLLCVLELFCPDA